MKIKLLFCSIAILFSSHIFAQYTVSGYIEDSLSAENLIGVNIYEPVAKQGTVTNVYGFYSITSQTPEFDLVISYIGYSPKTFHFNLKENTSFNIELSPSLDLKEVVVTAESNSESIQERTQMSTISLPIQQIKSLPALLGEVDVLKTLQLMPGISSGQEGSSGIYVRGGSPDQNLILLDGVPVYNASHLFGFFSVFNADAIKHVQLTKGGFPARYGGRLSSVLEINMKEGDMNKIHGEGSIGLISSKLTLEGPIVKGKTSFLVSGRRTYIDAITRPILKKRGEGVGGYYFYDLNAKLNHKFNDKHRLFLSFYSGKDKFYIDDSQKFNRNGKEITDIFKTDLQWGNYTTSLRYNYMINQKLFANFTGTFSRYRFEINAEDSQRKIRPDGTEDYEAFKLEYFSFIEDWGGKVDFDYIPHPNHYIKFGGNATYHTFRPGAIQYSEEQTGQPNQNQKLGSKNTYATSMFLYGEDDFKIGKNFKANIGLHVSGFAVDDTVYLSPEPRIGLKYSINNLFSIKASYAKMRQYVHLLTNSSVGLPTDLWVPSTKKVSPQQSHQWAIGLAKNFGKDIEVSVEGYYKTMQNLIEYKEGASFISIDENWEDKIEKGKGTAYGAEVFVQKKAGKTTGWIGYTLSWSNRVFDNLNNGKEFPYKYDRRHDLSVVVSHKFNKRINLSATWVYGTGASITLPQASYSGVFPDPIKDIFPNWYDGNNIIEVNDYGDRNSYRMRAYHRLDIGAQFTKKTKWGQRTFSVGTYNSYSRKNPFFIYLGTDDFGNEEFKQVSIFPILPYFNFSFKF